MNNSSLYHLSSLSNASLNKSDSTADLPTQSVQCSQAEQDFNCERSDPGLQPPHVLLTSSGGVVPASVPSEHLSRVDLSPQTNSLQLHQHDEGDDLNQFIAEKALNPQDSKFSSSRSVVSSASTYNSLYSSLSNDSEDLDLETVKLPFDTLNISKPKASRLKRIQQFLTGDRLEERSLDDNEKFVAYVDTKLATLYSYDETVVLNVDFAEAAEVFFFGEPLSLLFTSEQSLVQYLMQSSFELGEVRFSNLNRFHSDALYDITQLLIELKPQLATFNDLLDLYAVSSDKINRSELFEVFSNFANESKGLCIPLAISMFGNWLLTFDRDSAVESNYQNDLILNFFRKLIRLALVIRRLVPVFDLHLEKFPRSERYDLSRFWKKDNIIALSTSLHSLGEYYQYNHEHDKATTLWEINCHLTEDSESGNLAILGLSNGYGYGNNCKKLNRLGRRLKKHRYNTKRRTAHIYRILMKLPDFDEYGVSWVTKDKYD